ncbi:hypothetical protein C8R47DRAFT_1124999 [Mycena vitilis]|nr:hypothetical protein C8R47DRAFT_1124999 [Mycena vitilis]
MPNFEDSNARTIWIVDALKSAVQDSSYQVLLPWLHPSTWDSVASPVDSIRNGLKFAGRRSLGYCLLLAFFDVASGPEAGCLPGHYETVEECLLREDVLVEILLKLRHPGVAPIATRGSKVRDPFLVFVGGLWQDTQNLGKVLPFVIQIFVPLIRVAMRAYNELYDLALQLAFDQAHTFAPVVRITLARSTRERGYQSQVQVVLES